jgi:hypothetical protein
MAYSGNGGYDEHKLQDLPPGGGNVSNLNSQIDRLSSDIRFYSTIILAMKRREPYLYLMVDMEPVHSTAHTTLKAVSEQILLLSDLLPPTVLRKHMRQTISHTAANMVPRPNIMSN